MTTAYQGPQAGDLRADEPGSKPATAPATTPRPSGATRRSFWALRLPGWIGRAVLIAGGVVMLVPFAWMILSAFKPASEILRTVPTIFPETPTLKNFENVIGGHNFLQYMLNSIIVTTSITVLVVATSTILGFVFAKMQFVGRDAIFLVFLATMAIPFEIIAIPLLLEFEAIGGVDQLWGLVVPFSLDIFAIYLCRQFMITIPNDYIDAGRVDGLGYLGIFRRIVLPMSRPAIAAVAILTFLYNWDQVFWPLVLINSDAHKTVPLGIILLSTQFGPVYDLTMAASALTVVPVILVFLVFRRQFIGGLTLSGLKG